MPLSVEKLKRLRAVVRAHINWFLASLVGEEVLTSTELEEIQKLGLPPVDSVEFTKRAFSLGRVKALVKRSVWKDLTPSKFDSLRQGQSLSATEELALQQANLRVSKAVKSLGTLIESGVFSELEKVTGELVTEATLKEIVQDEVRLALLENKTVDELAERLAKATHTPALPKWRTISRTELHAAKTSAVAQTIANKREVYSSVGGPDSKVSVVPHPGTCPDCAKHYLDPEGNPKVFVLRDLLRAGSNADSGVSHKREGGLHAHWKTTLPPLHPNCRCELVFIPPGYSWKNGKLTLVDKESLVKAIGGGDSSSPEPMKAPASIPGVPSPAQGSSGPSGQDVEYIPKDKVPKRPPNAIGETPNSWKVPPGGSKNLKTEDGKESTDSLPDEADLPTEVAAAADWGKQPHPHDVVLEHLSNGKITTVTDVGEGVNGAKRVTIDGNGRGVMKSTGIPNESDRISRDKGIAVSQGWQSVPHDTYAQREKAAYTLAVASGYPDLVPPTTTRVVDGELRSMQKWMEDYKMFSKLPKGTKVKDVIEYGGPAEKEKRLEKLQELVSFQIVTGACDAHLGNALLDPKSGDVKAIDMGAAFPNGMDGVNSSLLRAMHKEGFLVKMPPKMMERYEKMSLGDVKRAMGDKFSDWEAGQQFMRQQYCLHLMKTEGHLDANKFQPVSGSGDGEVRVMLGHDSLKEGFDEYQKLKESGKDPQTLFEGFCKAWMDEALQDKSHPHHETAKQLDEIGIFMPPTGTAKDPKAVRQEGRHREYEKTVKAQWPEKAFPSARAKPMGKVDIPSTSTPRPMAFRGKKPVGDVPSSKTPRPRAFRGTKPGGGMASQDKGTIPGKKIRKRDDE